MPLLGHLKFRIKTDDRDRVQRMIDEFDTDLSGDVGFEEFEDIVQRILENLQFIAAEQTIAFARSMGFSTKELGDYHWAFDQMDRDMSGGMNIQEVGRTLAKLGHNLTGKQLMACYEEINLNPDKDLPIFDFLRLLKVALYEDRALPAESPYKLADVSDEKLREVLGFWRLSETYITELPREELEEVVADYLEIKKWFNLREELTEPVRDSKQLLSFARRKAERERLATNWTRRGGAPDLKELNF